LEYVAGALGVARSRAYHVATFYKAFSLKPRGRHTFCVCRGTACHVQGADKVAELLRMKLGVSEGEMTEDGLFSVESVRCLGCCSLAPAVMVDGAVFGQINRNTLQDIIETYADEDEED
jgi:NADH:ubiquinone oxidoreductase subunit E